MTWKQVRAAFIRLRERAKLKQEDVAAKGGTTQGRVSSLENNDKYGPNVETLLRAVKGLGLSASEFFRHVEGQTPNLLLEQKATDHNTETAHQQRVVHDRDVIGDRLRQPSSAVTITLSPDQTIILSEAIALAVGPAVRDAMRDALRDFNAANPRGKKADSR